ncbi:MAG: tetratricopeptide repeat protein [Treponema sp.]|nr:tetratricopeptide repeat protein [Treponema sp.]
MSAKARTEKFGIGDKVNELIQRHRKPLVITLMGIVLAVIALIIVFTVRDSLSSQAFSKVDEFDRRYQAITAKATDSPGTDQSQDIKTLLDDLALFQKRNSGYAAARAYATSASIYEDQSDWASAQQAWTSAATSAVKTYFSPVAYFNAAVAAEEQGDQSGAIDLYKKALGLGIQFPTASRAQFSIGRIYESMGDSASAIAAYQSLVSQGSQDEIWVNLAHSRILFLTLGQ